MAEMKLIHATKSKETSQTTLLQSVQFILYHLVKILIAYTVLIPTFIIIVTYQDGICYQDLHQMIKNELN